MKGKPYKEKNLLLFRVFLKGLDLPPPPVCLERFKQLEKKPLFYKVFGFWSSSSIFLVKYQCQSRKKVPYHLWNFFADPVKARGCSTNSLMIKSVRKPFPPTALWRRHAQTVRDSSSSYKINYVIVIKNCLNPEGHQNPISGSKVTAILLKGWVWPIGGASAVEGVQSTGLPCLVSNTSRKVLPKKMSKHEQNQKSLKFWNSDMTPPPLEKKPNRNLFFLLDGFPKSMNVMLEKPS